MHNAFCGDRLSAPTAQHSFNRAALAAYGTNRIALNSKVIDAKGTLNTTDTTRSTVTSTTLPDGYKACFEAVAHPRKLPMSACSSHFQKAPIVLGNQQFGEDGTQLFDQQQKSRCGNEAPERAALMEQRAGAGQFSRPCRPDLGCAEIPIVSHQRLGLRCSLGDHSDFPPSAQAAACRSLPVVTPGYNHTRS